MAKATIILPTTIDRGPLLEFSVGSVLQQTETSWELYIVGDGVHDGTKQTAKELAASDPRIHFFDYPKHPRRGEDYRHQLLANAGSDIVCYLCDRDLMLPNHLSVMHRLLRDTDFGHSLIVKLSPAGRFNFYGSIDVAKASHRDAVVSGIAGIPLSITAHRLDAYRRLPHGWRTTPAQHPTDRYMWQQFLSRDDIRAATHLIPTVIYLRRGKHPGLSTEERFEELKFYFEKYCRPGGAEAYQEALNRQLVEDSGEAHFALARRLVRALRRKWFRLWGNRRSARNPGLRSSQS